MADPKQDDAGDAFGAVALYMDQVLNLSRALQTVLEMEANEPLEGDQVGALTKAVTRAAEDAQSMFEAHFHPSVVGAS